MFPHTTLWLAGETDLLVIGSREALMPRVQRAHDESLRRTVEQTRRTPPGARSGSKPGGPA